MNGPTSSEVGKGRMYIRLAPLLPFTFCWARGSWTGAVIATLLLICPSASWAQCSEKVASFDLVQNEDGDIIIPALLQDTSTDMGLDFSFTWSSLRAGAAQKLGLPLRKILTKRTYHTSGVEITHFLEVPSVKLGSMSKRMELMALPEEARIDPRINGWLALNVLADFDVEIDFGNAKLNLFQPGRCTPEKTAYWTKDFDVLPLSVRKFGNVDFPAVLDGQNIQMNLAVSDSIGYVKMSAGPFDASPEKNRDATAQPGGARLGSFSSLKIGKQEVKNLDLYVMDDRAQPCQPRFQCFGAESGASVSLKQLKDLHLFFAFHDKRLYVSAANAK